MITYYGHCAFLWTSGRGVRVLIDPFGNEQGRHRFDRRFPPIEADASTSRRGVRVLIDPLEYEQGRHWFDRRFPPIEVDVVAVTHDHFDHNAVEDLPGTPTVLRGPGQFRLDDINVQGVRDLHSSESGRRGMVNTMFVVESDGVRYCHIGDNRHDIPENVLSQLGNVDVLMVTVDDSCHLLTFDQVTQLVSQLSPRVVVPMHYHIGGLTADTSTLEPPEAWLATQRDVLRLHGEPQEIGVKDLPDHQQVWVFPPVLS
jgi:L-ascorbate metabolism protein UlaG (beta-lactamase superfamily)